MFVSHARACENSDHQLLVYFFQFGLCLIVFVENFHEIKFSESKRSNETRNLTNTRERQSQKHLMTRIEIEKLKIMLLLYNQILTYSS